MLILLLLLLGCAMPSPPPPAPTTPAPAAAAVPVAAPVRVIAELRPAAGLPRLAAITRVQDEVIASLPAGQARIVQRYTTLPLLALEVDPALVAALKQNPSVVSVSPDTHRSMQVE
jgi:hypothetical protein